MRKIAIFMLGAVLIGANITQASEPGPVADTRANGDHHDGDHHEHRRGRRRTELSCRFVGAGVVPGAPVGKKGAPGVGLPAGVVLSSCAAVARLGGDRDRSREDDWEDEGFGRNEFAVSCDGVPVYSDIGIRSRIDGFLFLTGVVGDPILKLVRDRDFDDFDDRDGGDCGNNGNCGHDRRSEVVPAWLNLRGNILEGFCAVETRERRHHDNQGDNHNDHGTPPTLN